MIYSTLKSLILASNSPRRKDFFQDLGLTFTIRAEEIDETPLAGELPVSFVERMAREKARTVSGKCNDSYVVAADTVVCLENQILGKPENRADAVKMLTALSGRSHIVRSGYCVMNLSEKVEVVGSVATNVYFSDFSSAVAKAYVSCGESLDKAGAYGIQGKGAFLVEKIEGSYSNVVGLPLAEVVAVLEQLGIIAPVCAKELV